MKSKTISYLKLVLKISLTLIALFFVFKKIDFQVFIQNISKVNIFMFLASLLMFNISKIVSAFRLKLFYQDAKIHLPWKINLRFYYFGMFYNLFLPGSIGGDAYKVILLKQHADVKTKYIISATLLDRISGVVILFLMALFFLFMSSYQSPLYYFKYLVFGVLVLIIPIHYFLIKIFFPVFKNSFVKTTLYSFVVQAGQVFSALLLLNSLGLVNNIWDYLTLFMISCVIAILPISFGGAGAREMVFLFGNQLMNINNESSIAFSLLFFAVTALSSLIGLFFIIAIEKELKKIKSNINSNEN